MGTQYRSITINRPLVERLQPLVCCSGTQETCRDDDFCSSDPNDWPRLSNGIEKTRLTYPIDTEKPSIPGVPNFCDAYLDWYTETNCGPLAKDIAMNLSSVGHCAAGVNPQAYIDRVLKQVPPDDRPVVEQVLQEAMKSSVGPVSQSCSDMERTISKMRTTIESRCNILYKDGSGGRHFNPDRAEDLNNLAEFCRMVGSAEQQRLRASDPNDPHWKDFFRGGGFVAAVLGVVYVLYRGVRAIVRISRGISEADTALNTGSKSLKHFLGITLRNFGSTMKYAATLGWLRGKAPPPDIPDPAPAEPTPPPAPQRIEIHVHAPGDGVPNEIEAGGRPATPAPSIAGRQPTPAPIPDAAESGTPHPDVVGAQLLNLASSERYAREGLRFSLLSTEAQRYLAHHAIERWRREPPERQERFIAEDSRLTEGKLPIDYLLEIARRFLAKDEMLPVIEASARVWHERGHAVRRVVGAAFVVPGVRPSIDAVRRQLLTNSRYSRLSVEAQEYVARRIIVRWDSLRNGEHIAFLDSQRLPEEGALPQAFIRLIRKRELQDFRTIERNGRVVAQLFREVPELSYAPFSVVDLRAGNLFSAWEALPRESQDAFVAHDREMSPLSTRGVLPHSFVQNLRGALRHGTSPRNAPTPAPKPWSANGAAPKVVDGYDLRGVMQAVVHLNGSAASYPALLELRAHSIVEGWTSLDDTVRHSFLDYEGTPPGQVPSAYIQLWHATSRGIGTVPRDEQSLSFSGMFDVSAPGPSEAAPGIHDAQPPALGEIDDITAGAAVMTGESVVSDAVPLVVPGAAGMGVIVK